MSVELRNDARPRIADLWNLAFSAMRQQKVRTVLTLIGVVVGTFALSLSLAVGRGVDRAIVSLFHQDDRLRKIQVDLRYEDSDIPAEQSEPKGQMSDAKRARIRQALIRHWGGPRRSRVKLTPDALAGLERMEHVLRAVPIVRRLSAKASLDGKSLEDAEISSVAKETDFFQDRLIAGRLFAPDDRNVAIVHEYLLYRWGLAGDADAESALGQKFGIEYRTNPAQTFDLSWVLRRGNGEISASQRKALESALKRLAGLVRFLPIPAEERAVLRDLFEHVTASSTTAAPQRIYTEDFTIVGVIREWAEKDRDPSGFGEYAIQISDILIPAQAAVSFLLRDPDLAKEGFGEAVVTVDQENDVEAVAKKIQSMGYNQWSLAGIIGTVRMNVMLVSLATAFVAVVALIVAAIGITNTMIMSVLERTHEIGVMKALGARDGHIRLIFVVEGIIMGLVGSSLGLALAWLSSFPGDSIARSIMEPQTRTPVKDTLFAFPVWVVLGVPALVCLITTLAAWYPASRARGSIR